MKQERIHILNHLPEKNGQYVLYRMQAAVRSRDNLALSEAVRIANRLQLPLWVVFRLDPDFPDANYRHFCFLADGIREFMAASLDMGCRFELLSGSLEEVYSPFLENAACVVTDRGYLRIQMEWRAWLANHASCRVVEVEDGLIVPVESASHKAEWAARTIRPKLMAKLDYFSSDFISEQPALYWRCPPDSQLICRNENILNDVLQTVRKKSLVEPVAGHGGECEAEKCLKEFVSVKLLGYADHRNDPSLQATSHLSAYLHFGHIAPLRILEAVKSHPDPVPFIEELFVRRELAHNYVHYVPDYDTYEALPSWAKRNLAMHASDPRPYLYSLQQLENGETHDVCWNAAMFEMKRIGFMQNTMRMYWGKKIIEWTATPTEAWRRIVFLNNRYFLDGRDPNSYAGIGWCFGLHDRPWQERSVFGRVRYMNETGLRRKYDMDAYISLFQS